MNIADEIEHIVTPDGNGGFIDILAIEWDQYEWHPATTWGDLTYRRQVYLRGKRKLLPPNDGYEYRRCDKFSDTEYRWERLIPVGELAGAK